MSSFSHQHGWTSRLSVTDNNGAITYAPTLGLGRMLPRGQFSPISRMQPLTLGTSDGNPTTSATPPTWQIILWQGILKGSSHKVEHSLLIRWTILSVLQAATNLINRELPMKLTIWCICCSKEWITWKLIWWRRLDLNQNVNYL